MWIAGASFWGESVPRLRRSSSDRSRELPADRGSGAGGGQAELGASPERSAKVLSGMDTRLLERFLRLSRDSDTMRSVSLRATALSFAGLAIALTVGAPDSSSARRDPDAFRVEVGGVRDLSSTIDGNVRIEARLRTATKGSFLMTGAISDVGSLATTRRVSGGRLRLTQMLTGKAGIIRIRTTRACTGGSGTWRVLSGSKAYAGLTGGGAASGGGRCLSPRYPTQAIYKGVVRTPPPPPLAQPGRFGGGTSQREEVILDVQEGGRTFAGLRLRVMTPCVGTTITSSVFISLPGPNAIGDDGRFSLASTVNVATASVTGRFTSLTTVEGTAKATTQVTVSAGNTTYPCSAEVTWRASLPPPAATPGTYCGFTNQGPSICLDVDPTGREVARIEFGVVVLCNGRTTEVEVRMVFTGIPIGGNLGFTRSSSTLEGLISGTGFINGLLDPNGGTGAHGSVRLQLPVFDFEGTRYTCGVGAAQWEARRQ